MGKAMLVLGVLAMVIAPLGGCASSGASSGGGCKCAAACKCPHCSSGGEKACGCGK